MLNAIDTTSSRQEACSLVLGGLESLREGLIKYHELGLTTKEIYADLKAAGWDKSLTTLKRHQTELRKEGLIAASSMAREQIAPKSERKPVEPSTPIPVTPVTTKPNPPINVPIREYAEPVLASVTVVDDTAEQDYAQCLEHIDAIIKLTKKYFHQGWDDRKWYELAGECRTIEACCTNHCGSDFGAGSQRSCG
tara:strand:- start:444 stop:1025 length:582 start_codon:yes stop_codon:yes gene_type:complete